ncbi:PREDICTED: uncharacterized protein LOC108559164 [Nicrophorus vespilloides]|uniref:Uncharacterized protein LOC108559164 n=1 Tax=Nicrophorus vespilloides TaxID=110193 RepID=A0ABM1MB74_NICVS|nr:PREDICTED: uncharacterized protein LOC108559164 [Nicrophorus vespilloides]
MSESDESDNEYQPFEQANNVLVAVDCSASMFVKNAEAKIPFEFTLNSLFSVCDNFLLKRSAKNQISIIFFHPEKTDLINFDSPFVEGVKNLNEAIKEYKTYNLLDCKGKPLKFAYFIILCKKKFSKVKGKKFLYLVTNHSDPCNGDVTVQSQSYREIMDLPKLGIQFELLPLCEDFDYLPFYGEVYRSLQEKQPKFYYNENFLSTKISYTIKAKESNKNLKIYLREDSEPDVFVPCLERKLFTKAKISENVSTTNDLKKVIKKTERSAKLSKIEISREIIKVFNETEVLDLYQTGNIKSGLTIIHAQHRRYSNYGEHAADCKLLKTKNKNDENFHALHTACSMGNYYLLCTLKHKEGGRVHYAELMPKIVNQEPHFVMITLKNSLNFSESHTVQSEIVTADEELENLMSSLVNKATIEDYDKRKMVPLKYAKESKFLKQKLLEDEHYLADKKDLDLLNDVLYEGNVDELVKKLEEMYPQETKKRAQKKPEKATNKKIKT